MSLLFLGDHLSVIFVYPTGTCSHIYDDTILYSFVHGSGEGCKRYPRSYMCARVQFFPLKNALKADHFHHSSCLGIIKRLLTF